MKTLNVFYRELPSDTNCICGIACDIFSFINASYGQVEECAAFDIQVIINELLINAIKHGNKYDKHKLVKITAGLAKNHSLILCVEDEGYGYDYKSLLKSETDSIDVADSFNMDESGRGLMIVSNLSDRIRFNETGNRVYILKRL